MKEVRILCGLPGSGKSYFAEVCSRAAGAAVVSADNYFMKDGKYGFDPALLGEAHGECLRKFIGEARVVTSEMLVVDNTNLSVEEIAPYYAIAEAYGWRPVIYIIGLPSEMMKYHARNTHGVPFSSFVRMSERFSRIYHDTAVVFPRRWTYVKV